MTGGDLILMSRRRACLSQRELADRIGCRQATIARWERGDRDPGFSDVDAVVRACSLQLDTHLVPEDRSWWPQIALQLELEPLQRLQQLTPASIRGVVEATKTLALANASVAVIGEVAGALQGWPLVLGGALEICGEPDATDLTAAALSARETGPGTYELPGGGRLHTEARPPGTAGEKDLRRGAKVLPMDGGTLAVAGLHDLMRIADASSEPDAHRQALALQAVLDVERAQATAASTPVPSNEKRIQA